MLEQGLIEEVKTLRDRGDLYEDLPAIRAVGYRQVWDYLSDRIDYTEMEERGVIATRQLAKRQFTWLRSEKDLISYDSSQDSIQQIQESVLKTVKQYLAAAYRCRVSDLLTPVRQGPVVPFIIDDGRVVRKICADLVHIYPAQCYHPTGIDITVTNSRLFFDVVPIR